MRTYKPVALIVLDGWGLAPPGPGNAIELAETPFFDRLWVAHPHTQLKASGEAVGLPKGEVGTSEVGHLNIGAGRIVWQDVSRINQTIKDNTFFKNPAFIQAINKVKESKGHLHLLGLAGGGTVHSSLDHLFALLDLCAKEGLSQDKVKIHFFADGRDSPPKSAQKFAELVTKKISAVGVGEIASVIGRYYAMDRDRRWERTEKAYRALTQGEGEKANTASEAIEQAYARGETDEFIKPTLIGENIVSDGDTIIFFNFRADRARQLTKAFVLADFKYFDRETYLANLFFVNLVECETGIPVSASAFVPHQIRANLAQIISQQGRKQLHVAESEKYAYVTYYFNGGIEPPYSGEDRVVVPSPKVATYDTAPAMSAATIASEVEQRVAQNPYDFVLVNLANPDMLGHTGIIKAAIKGVEATDKALKIIVLAILKNGGACLITADHGNAEEMINPATGEVSTSHSNNRVPFIAAGPKETFQPQELQSGILADIAPTVLKLMGIPKPSLMTGKSLL